MAKTPTSRRHHWAVIAAVLLVAATAAALVFRLARSRVQRDERPNVLLVTIDTLRADHVGSYGYAAARTPTLDALSARGLRFTQVPGRASEAFWLTSPLPAPEPASAAASHP